MRRFAAGSAFTTVLFLAAIAGVSGWGRDASPTATSSTAKQELLHVGMSAADLVEALGEPTSKHPNADGSESWSYSRMTWTTYNVRLDSQGTVVGHDEGF